MPAPTLCDGLPICRECNTAKDCIRDNFCFRRENARRQGAPYDWAARARHLLRTAVDAEDKAVVEAAAILAAGYGVRFISTIRNGLHVDVRVERLDYDAKAKVR